MSASKSRWADDDAETEAIIAQGKREKEEKRRAKAEKQRQLEQASKASAPAQSVNELQTANGDSGPPKKRRRLSNDPDGLSSTEEVARGEEQKKVSSLLRFPVREWGPCRHVDNFERLNHIEEGSYGWVSRAKDITTGEIVALKKLKIENSPDGFPVTGLREIQTLLEARHQNVVYLREVVMGNKMDE
jgi:cell division cycle 2-like protein